MAKEPTSPEKVPAIVVRGSFWTVNPVTGDRKEILPGLGEDSVVMVTPNQLKAFVGVLAEPSKASAEIEKAIAEGMQAPTPTNEAIKDDTVSKTKK